MTDLSRQERNIKAAGDISEEVRRIFRDFQQKTNSDNDRRTYLLGDHHRWVCMIERVKLSNDLLKSLYHYDITITYLIKSGTWSIRYDQLTRFGRTRRYILKQYHGGAESFKGWFAKTLRQIEAAN